MRYRPPPSRVARRRGAGALPLAPARRGDGLPVRVLRRLEVHVDDVREVDAVHERPAVGLLAGRLGLLGGLAPRRRRRRRRLVRRRRGRRGGRARARARVVRRRLRGSALLPLRRARPRGAGPPLRLGGGPPPLRAVRDGGGGAEDDDDPPKHLFEGLGEREAHGAVQHPAQGAPLVSAAPSTLAAADAAEVLEGDQASARSVECSWRAAARTSRAARAGVLRLVSLQAASARDSDIAHCSGGFAEAVQLRRRYAVMKEAARARRR